MVLLRLDNSRWGFTTNCFVCETSNANGLRVPFFCDPDERVVVADLTLGDAFSGAPQYVHGGVVAAVLDEALAWAAIALAARLAITRELNVMYERPVRVDRAHRVTARLTNSSGPGTIGAVGEITRTDGKVCATASATLVELGEAELLDAIGLEDLGAAKGYLPPDGVDGHGE